MNEPIILVLAVFAGGGLGMLFFGGLWWTVRKGTASRHPALWFLGSLLLRTTMALAGLHFVSGGHWDRLLSCLLGFVIARFFLMWLAGPPVVREPSTQKDVSHAS